MKTQKRKASGGASIIGPKEQQLILINAALYSVAALAFLWKDLGRVVHWLVG